MSGEPLAKLMDRDGYITKTDDRKDPQGRGASRQSREGDPAQCLQSVVGLNIRADNASFDTGLDLQTASHGLTVIHFARLAHIVHN
jgi:hypothetical protein